MSRKKQKSEKEDNFIKSNRIYHVLIGITFVLIALIAFVGLILMRQYENAVLKIYSEQQDNYVQLVVDQINLQPDRADEEIISKIIETLDSGASHYWTLSKDETLIFVKNVTETNRYQGVRTDDFYVTESAAAFIEHLTLYRVKHDVIRMDDVRYVVSGVLFEYNEGIYKICLLTNETVILDNNDFLSTKINMYIFVIVLIVLIFIVVLASQNLVHRRQLRIYQLNNRIRNQNIHIQNLEKEIEYVNFYDSRWNLYNRKLLKKFVEMFDSKEIKTAVYAEVAFPSEKERKKFLSDAEFILDEHVLRFDKSDSELILLFANCGEPAAKRILKSAGVTEDMIKKIRPVDYDYCGPLADQLRNYILEE